MMFADTTFATAQDLASACARRTMNTWHVLDDRGHYLIADDQDAAAWGDRVVWSVEPEMAFSAAELDGPIPDDVELICGACDGEGRIPAYGYGDQAGGYAETCPDCNGKVEPELAPVGQRDPYACSVAHPCDRPNHNHTGYGDVRQVPNPRAQVVSTDFEAIRTQEFYEDERDYIEEKIQATEPSLLTDVHTVLSRCLSNDALVGVIPEIERVLHRVEQALCVEQVMTA